MNGSDPIKVPKAAALVASRIRSQIVRGDIEEGAALPNESELMRFYDVSRPTLREALRILENESLIMVARGARGGARVRRPDVAVAARYAALVLQAEGTMLADVFTARTTIEPAAARLLAEQRSPAAIDALRRLHDDELAVAQDPAAFALAAARFHEGVFEHAGSNTLTLIGRMLLQLVESNNQATMERLPRRTTAAAAKDAIHQHERLIELIEAGDTAGAEAAWRSHMQQAAKVALKNLGSMTVVDLLER
jgi:DNA-binding FadR family transcriptional regulator